MIIIGLSLALAIAQPELICEKKWGEMTWEGMQFKRYRLRAEHFPPGKKFQLIIKSFDGFQMETYDYLCNKKGHLILQPGEDVEGDIYAVCPAVRGEKFTFIMHSENGDVETDIVPFPLEMKSKKGVKLQLELQGTQGEKFSLFATGLEPKEAVELLCEYNDQKLPIHTEVTPLGDLVVSIDFPADGSGGEAKLILNRNSEQIVFPFQWGSAANAVIGALCLEIRH
jgi:hypothetical protein